jgi:hypothetical protein
VHSHEHDGQRGLSRTCAVGVLCPCTAELHCPAPGGPPRNTKTQSFRWDTSQSRDIIAVLRTPSEILQYARYGCAQFAPKGEPSVAVAQSAIKGRSMQHNICCVALVEMTAGPF